jgi:hypothetical protein
MISLDSPSIRIGDDGIRFGGPAFVIGDKAPAFGTGGGLPFGVIFDDLLGGYVRDDLSSNQYVVEG